MTQKRIVQVKIVFLSLSSIDTSAEKFSAEVYIEAKWEVFNKDEFTAKTPSWTPSVFIINYLNIIETKKWFKKIKINEEKMFIYEVQKIKGDFFEKLELQHYPFDIQKLHVKLVSSVDYNECALVPSDDNGSSILHDGFRDLKEWLLYDFVGIEENTFIHTPYEEKECKRSIINFYCVVSRKTEYFYWNSFFLIFLLTILSLVSFAVPVDQLGDRLDVQFNLILSLVSFKWVINEDLPSLDYLTVLDLYSIFSLVFLSFITLWHSIVSYLSRYNDEYTSVDAYFFIVILVIYLVGHIFAILWVYFRLYAPRRHFNKLRFTFTQ